MTEAPRLSVNTAEVQDPVAEAENENSQPATKWTEESKATEASPEVNPGAAAKKPRIIKAPVVHQDPTLYLKTYTGDRE